MGFNYRTTPLPAEALSSSPQDLTIFTLSNLLLGKLDPNYGDPVCQGFSSRGLKHHQTNEFNFENHDFFEKIAIFGIYRPLYFVQEVQIKTKNYVFLDLD